jgi:hypothetical protein
MSYLRATIVLFFVFLITMPNFMVPIVVSTPLNKPQLTSDYLKKLSLSYTYNLSSIRNNFPLLIPALGGKQDAEIGNGDLKADIFVLVFPAAPGKEISATEIISSAATEFFTNVKSILNPPELVKDLYITVYKKLLEAGAQPAFIPYENVSFIVLTIIWIKPKNMEEGLTDIVTGLGLSAVKSMSDGLIIMTLGLMGDTLDNIGTSAKEEAKNIIDSTINNAKTNVINVFEGLSQDVSNIKCSCMHTIIKDNVTICDSFKAELNIEQSLSDLSKQLHIDVDSSISSIARQTTYQFTIKANEKTNDVLKVTTASQSNKGIFSNDAGIKANQIISQFGNIIYSNIKQDLTPKFGNSVDSIFNNLNKIISGTGGSCDDAKQIALSNLNNLEKRILNSLDNLKYELSKTANETIDSEINEIKNAVMRIGSNIKKVIDDAISQAEEPVKETIGNAVQTAISGTVATSSAPVFIVYAVGQGLFQALQTWINSVDVTCLLDASSISNSPLDNDGKLIVIERQQSDQKLNVRFPEKGETVTATGSPPPYDKISSAAKGFLRGLFGTVASLFGAGESIQKAFDAVPAFVLVNIKIEKNSKYVVAQPKPGIYAIEMKLNVETGADMVSHFADGIKNAIFGSNSQKENAYLETMENSLDKSIKESSGEGNSQLHLEKGINIVVPYLVLPPYFVTESVDTVDGAVTIRLRAVYDFSALFRDDIEKLRKKLYEVRYQTSLLENDLQKLEEEINDIFENMIGEVIEKIYTWIINNKITQDDTGSEMIRAILVALKDWIKEQIKQIIYEAIKNYLSEILNTAKMLLEEATDLLDQGIDALYMVEQLLAISFTIFKVNVTNCGKMGIVAVFPQLGLVSTPITDTGEATVFTRLEILRPAGLSSMGAMAAFQRLDKEGKVSYVYVPGAIASLEPIVVPLLPSSFIMNGKLYLGFVNSFCSNPLTPRAGISIRLEFIADQKVIEAGWYNGTSYSIDLGKIQNVAVVSIRLKEIYSVKGCRSIRAAPVVFVPIADEIPILVNPQAFLERF